MIGKLSGHRARSAAAQLEIDRAIVARRLSGAAARRTTLHLPDGKLRTPFDAHPVAAAVSAIAAAAPP
jgi:hypothetical protein